MFYAWPSNTNRVDLLESIVPYKIGWHLCRQHHQRDRIHIGSRDSGDRIGHTRARGNQHHTGLAGSSRVAVRCVGRALFVAGKDVLYIILLIKGIVDMQCCAARIAEYMLDTLILEALNDDFGAGQFHALPSIGKLG